MQNITKKCSEETQTLHAGCNKVKPIFFAHRRPLPKGAGRPKFNQFGEDRCTQFQFRVIMVTDPQTKTPTNRQDRLQYTAPQLARSVTNLNR